MFVIIMISICSHTQGPVTDKKEGFKIKALQTNFTITATLAVVFGLGWGLGLAATSLPVKELTLIFQILFSIFVGTQGVLIFLLHGVRNQDIRKIWIQCFAAIGQKTHLVSILSSTKASSVGSETSRATRNVSGVSKLQPCKNPSAIEMTYCKQASVGGSTAMEGNVDSDEEHNYDDVYVEKVNNDSV